MGMKLEMGIWGSKRQSHILHLKERTFNEMNSILFKKSVRNRIQFIICTFVMDCFVNANFIIHKPMEDGIED